MVQVLGSLRALLVFTVLTGVLYPLVVTVSAQVAFSHQARGSLVRQGDRVVGSSIIGQDWDGNEWFYGRPSAVDYDSSASGGRNLGPLSDDLAADLADRIAAITAIEEPYRGPVASSDIPVDLVTSSASGLDPDISVAGALFQSPRIAEVRGLPLERVEALIRDLAVPKTLGVWGQERVKVLQLNLALVRT